MMKRLSISILCVLFLLSLSAGKVCAQTSDEGENYYSNPQKGIKPTAPSVYRDTSVVSKSEDITVELVGSVDDTIVPKDTTKIKLKSISEYSRAENPYYWGPNVYWSLDPWYSPRWNGWYYPGWGGSHWMLTYGWGCGPYWSFGLGWSWGWGSPWWYWDPYFYPGYYYGYYGWGGYAYGWNRYDRDGYAFGHGYLGGGRGAAKGIAPRGGSVTPNPARPVRRGGVDLNNGGRAPRGSVSGTGSRGSIASASGNGRGTTSVNTGSGRYAKPASVASNRAARSENRGSYGTPRTTDGRGSYGNSRSNSRFETNRNGNRGNYESGRRTSSRQNDYNFRQSSSRSTSSSFRSGSSSSRGGSFSTGSSSRSGGSFSGGSSSRGGSSVGRR